MAAQDDKPGIAGLEVRANEQEALASHRRQVRRALEASGTSPRMGTMVRKSVEDEAIQSSDKAGCAPMEEPDHLSCV
jgi:plasmid stabilization system protein ParE